MNEVTSSQDELSEVDNLYRRLSASDPGRPGEWVRRKVQAYAAQQAAERAVRDSAKARAVASPAPAVPAPAPAPQATPSPVAFEAKGTASKPWLIPAIAGAVVAAGVVVYLVMPHGSAPHDTSTIAAAPSPVSSPEPVAARAEPQEPEVAQAPAPSASEPPASPPPAAQASEPEPPAPAPPVAQTPPPPATTTPAAPRSSAPATPAVASSPAKANTAHVPAPTQPRLARQTAPAPQSAPVAQSAPPASTRAETEARPTPPPAAPAAASSTPAPSPDTRQAAAAAPAPSPPPAAAPAVAQSAPAPTSAAPAAPTAPPEDLYRASESGDLALLRSVLENNIDVNVPDSKGHTALILAVQRSRLDAVKMLLAHGASPTKADNHGATPMTAAYSTGNYEILHALQRSAKH